MENIIGDDIFRAPSLLAEPDLVLHLYGKTEARPGRKMGHFTRLAPRNPSSARYSAGTRQDKPAAPAIAFTVDSRKAPRL